MRLSFSQLPDSLQSLQPEFQLRGQSTDPLASSIKGEKCAVSRGIYSTSRGRAESLLIYVLRLRVARRVFCCHLKYEMERPGGWRILTIPGVSIHLAICPLGRLQTYRQKGRHTDRQIDRQID